MERYRRPTIMFYGLIGIIYLLMLLIIKPQEPAVFFLWLFSVSIIVVRLRFNLLSKYIVVDMLFYLALYWFYDIALILFIPTIVLGIYKGQGWLAFFALLVWVGLSQFDVESLILMVFASVTSVVLFSWEKDQSKNIHAIDDLRIKRYELEQERVTLLDAQDEISRLSVLTERDRIAQRLHDDLGHALTGALLASRAFESQLEEVVYNRSYQAVKKRLEEAVNSLKETVHHTRPEEEYGFERFKDLIASFEDAEVVFEQKGVLDRLKVTHWHLLYTVLKEALTNVQKHSLATLVEIELSVDERLARLTVKNDKITKKDSKSGVGLQYMRRRIEAVGGTLSVRKDFHFTLICIIPITLEEGI